MRLSTSAWLATLALLPAILTASRAEACSFGSSSEPTLQTTFNSLLGSATVDVETACFADGADALWSTVNLVGEVDIQVELASNADFNTFGIYDPVNGNLIRLFEGNDMAGVFGTIKITNSGGNWYAQVRDSHLDTSWSAPQQLSSSTFGFYLGTDNGTFYSETSRNSDGTDHLYAYGPLTGDPQWEGQYIQAWEDISGGGDRDYQDFVVSLIDISPVPVPVPAAAWLMLCGVAGLAGIARRRRKS